MTLAPAPSDRPYNPSTVADVVTTLIDIARHSSSGDLTASTADPRLRLATMRELLEGFLIARAEIAPNPVPSHARRTSGLTGLIQTVVIYVLHRTHAERDPAALVDTLLEHPDETVVLLGEVIARVRWPASVAASGELGRLSRSLYDASGLAGGLSRADYLLTQLELEMELDDTAHALARVLALDWAGTLPALLETARSLANAA